MNSFFGPKRGETLTDIALGIVAKAEYDNIVRAIYFDIAGFQLSRQVKKHLNMIAKNTVFAKLKYTVLCHSTKWWRT